MEKERNSLPADAQAGRPKAKKKTVKIDIFKAWCKACGICAAFCPTHVLSRDEAGFPYVNDLVRCINCGWCEIRCPDFAITVETEAKGKRRAEDKDEEEKENRPDSGQ